MTLENGAFYAPERILAIAAHADDLDFGISGTVARWTAAGSQVTYCIVSNNAAGSNTPGVRTAELILTRREEQIAAAKVVGVEDVRFLNYSDGHITPSLQLRRDLTRLIREIRPQLVVTFDPTIFMTEDLTYINHPDHRAVGEAAMYAVFPSAGSRPIFPELLVEGYEPHDVSRLYFMLTDKPNLTVDISETIKQKQDALHCHQSQNLDEKVVEMVMEWSAKAGEEHGYAHAESFKVLILRAEEEPDTVAKDEAKAAQNGA